MVLFRCTGLGLLVEHYLQRSCIRWYFGHARKWDLQPPQTPTTLKWIMMPNCDNIWPIKGGNPVYRMYSCLSGKRAYGWNKTKPLLQESGKKLLRIFLGFLVNILKPYFYEVHVITMTLPNFTSPLKKISIETRRGTLGFFLNIVFGGARGSCWFA